MDPSGLKWVLIRIGKKVTPIWISTDQDPKILGEDKSKTRWPFNAMELAEAIKTLNSNPNKQWADIGDPRGLAGRGSYRVDRPVGPPAFDPPFEAIWGFMPFEGDKPLIDEETGNKIIEVAEAVQNKMNRVRYLCVGGALATPVVVAGAVAASPVVAAAGTAVAAEASTTYGMLTISTTGGLSYAGARYGIPVTNTVLAAVRNPLEQVPLSGSSRIASLSESFGINISSNKLATAPNQAVFWSGIRGSDGAAAAWVGKNGGATLETTLAERGIILPAWNKNDPTVVAAWRSYSRQFAEGASGDVKVLQPGDAMRFSAKPGDGSVWAQIEWVALLLNPKVRSITSVNPETGAEVVLWTR